MASYAQHGYCPHCDAEGQAYGGRFFTESSNAEPFNAGYSEWNQRKDCDLAQYWPEEKLFEYKQGNTSMLYNQPQHGITHWRKMFNPRQLLVHSLLLKSISTNESSSDVREFVLGAFQQYLRNQNMYSFWNPQRDTPEPLFSNNNFHPKSSVIENNVYSKLGRGNWLSQHGNLFAAIDWQQSPWELVDNTYLATLNSELGGEVGGKSTKVFCDDPVSSGATLECGSSTDLASLEESSQDLVITDPPFGALVHYSDLADFFFSWLKIPLGDRYPNYFRGASTPKTLEVISNKGLAGREAEAFYQRLLTDCWREAHRILKPAGLLAFTFHHSEDKPWVAVLESLFDAGFYLVATYPIRSDETKGEGAKPGTFGSQTIEYDIIHVCRKRHEESKPISWAKLRRRVLHDVRDLQDLLEHHQEEGLPEADLQVIRRGKALEYFSRHYGKVYKGQDESMSVLEALLGINQLLDEEAGGIKEAPPHNAEPFTRMLLRLFDGVGELPRDQMQKFLRGTGSAPSDFISRGWIYEDKKVYFLTSPIDLAQEWIGKHRKGLQSDYDQAMFLLGACYEGSGINASETLNNENFNPHPALGAILIWFKTHGTDSPVRNSAITASKLYQNWESKNQSKVQQLSMFDALGEE